MSEMGQPCQSGSSLVSRTATSGPAVTRETLYQQHTHHTHPPVVPSFLSTSIKPSWRVLYRFNLCSASSTFAKSFTRSESRTTSPNLASSDFQGSLSHVILSQQITRLWLYFSVILDTLSTENHDYALSYTIPRKAYLIGGNVSKKRLDLVFFVTYLHLSGASRFL